MNQDFTYSQLLKLCKYKEIEREGLNDQLLKDRIIGLNNRLLEQNFSFSIEKKSSYYIVSEFEEVLLLRKLNDNLRRIYKDRQSNRDQIIRQMIILLEEGCPFWILKSDISSFYENIDRDYLIEKIEGDNLLSFYSLYLLREIFKNQSILQSPGLPRGLCISSTLSEIYLRSFDRKCKKSPGVYFYARFVDDIVIFSYEEGQIQRLSKELEDFLPEGLTINKEKTQLISRDSLLRRLHFEYLGYRFTLRKTPYNNKEELIISIGEKKLKKIKTRLVKCFLDHLKNRNFQLLKMRVVFLTGNYSIRKNQAGNQLKAGVFYNYKQVNDAKVFEELDTFYRKLLYSRFSNLGVRLYPTISADERAELAKYSFKFGFTNRVHNTFLPHELRRITSCWKV